MARILHTKVKQGEQLVATDITDLTFFPKGTILTFSTEAWNATSPEFKNIWKICNGQNGTPNLVNKFLRGGESSNFVTASGADSQTVTLTVDNLPRHNHKGVAQAYFWAPFGDNQRVAWENVNYERYTENTGGDQPFTVNTVPSHYTVIYIMKVI
jgi:hypothetical protein